MKKAALIKTSNMVFLNFFNSTHVYSLKGFDTERKAKNYAKKFGYELFYELPEGIAKFDNCN